MDDVTSTSTTGGGHFHATMEGQTIGDNTQDRAIWKGLINATWATKASQGKSRLMGVARCNSELFPDGHPSVVD